MSSRSPLQTFWYQYQIEYHYSLVAVPALAIGTVYAVGVLRDRTITLGAASVTVPVRVVAMGVLAVSSLWAAQHWSPLPWSDRQLWEADRDNIWARNARPLLDQIPADAVVAANYRVTPHLAYREEIYQFPVPFRVVRYGPDPAMEGTRLDERSERVEYVIIPVNRDERLAADWAAIDEAFVEVDGNEIWTLYRRDRSVPLPG